VTIWKREANLTVGDLVYHILYGRSWLGMIISTDSPSGSFPGRSNKVLIRMIPGTEYGDFFENRPAVLRDGYERGWVSDHWLIKIGSQNVIEK